jgi:hypothetical protein
MALEQEIEFYQRELQSLLQHEGKFVVICEQSILGIFDTYEDALKAGYNRYGLKPFLVKMIQSVEQAQFLSREIDLPCPS